MFELLRQQIKQRKARKLFFALTSRVGCTCAFFLKIESISTALINFLFKADFCFACERPQLVLFVGLDKAETSLKEPHQRLQEREEEKENKSDKQIKEDEKWLSWRQQANQWELG